MYIEVMPTMCDTPSADEYGIASTWRAESQAISAKLGEAARPSQSATSRGRPVATV